MNPIWNYDHELRYEELFHNVMPNEETAINWCKQHHLLAEEMICDLGHRCTWQTKPMSSTGVDQFHWRCTGKNHRVRLSIRKDSFFTKSHLPIRNILRIVYYWSWDTPLQVIEHEIPVGRKAGVDWLNFIREECGTHLLNHPAVIGGPGKTVTIDETKYFHRKYHRGRYRDGQWVFGGIDVDDPTKCFLVSVPNRERATLEPIIQQYVLPGTMIWSDEWPSYRNLSALGYVHHTVNHSQNFICPITCVHTNHIEGMWMRAKKKLRRMHGTSEELFDSYLEEWLWFARHQNFRFQHIISQIAEHYEF
jgi:hypothetical protein